MVLQKRESLRRTQLDIGTQWGEAIRYLSESQKYIYFVIALFVASVFFGFLFAKDLTFIDALLEDIVDKTIGLNPIELILFILQNNLMSALTACLAGIIFGIFPLVSATMNGLVLGYVFHRVIVVAGPWALWRILPHGIFELPAVFIAMGLGIKLGWVLFSGAKNISVEFRRRIYESANVFLMIIIPLLIIAAIIEGILIAFTG